MKNVRLLFREYLKDSFVSFLIIHVVMVTAVVVFAKNVPVEWAEPHQSYFIGATLVITIFIEFLYFAIEGDMISFFLSLILGVSLLIGFNWEAASVSMFLEIAKIYVPLSLIFLFLFAWWKESVYPHYRLAHGRIAHGHHVHVTKEEVEDKDNSCVKIAARRMAEHEAGHAILTCYMDFTVESIMIDLARLEKQCVVAGAMAKDDLEWVVGSLVSYEHYKKCACIYYAGMAANQVLHPEDGLPGGGLDDIQKATVNLQIYLRYLFNDKENTLLAKEVIEPKELLHQIEEYQTKELIFLAKECYAQTKDILWLNIEVLEKLADLIEREHTVDKKQIKEFFENNEVKKLICIEREDKSNFRKKSNMDNVSM